MKLTILLILIALFSTVGYAQQTEYQYQAADQSVFVMPTAYTMPKGTQAFTDYEVIMLQYTNAITDHTHLSAMSAFPITKEMLDTFTLGLKQNYFRRNKFQTALWTSYTIHFHMMSVGNVISYGTPKSSGHLAVSWGTDFTTSSDNFAFALGTIQNVSSRLALLGEFITATQILEDDANGLIVFGVRFKGDRMSWDLGAFRPLQGDTGDLIALPFLKATFAF